MYGFAAVYLREMLILKYRFKRQLAGMAVTPLLYLLTFGCAMGGIIRLEGGSYLEFLVPGLVAMSSMTQAFGIATDINVARFYWKIFEEFQASPISSMAYVAAESLAGITRALLAIGVILALSGCFGVTLHCSPVFWLAVLLNAAVFSSLAVALAMLVKSHADQALLNSFIITPMAFLGGTFFPLDNLPGWVQGLLSLLPLSHASRAIRAAALDQPVQFWDYALLLILALACFTLALHCVDKARE